MQDEHLTHEWLDAYDALLVGDAKPTLKLIALDKPMPELVRSHLMRLFDGYDEGNDSCKINVRMKRIGRKELLKPNFTESQSTELLQFWDFWSKRSGKQINFVEELMCEELGTNFN